MNPFYCRCAEYFVINIAIFAIYVKKEKEANASFKTYQKYHQYALKNINSIFQFPKKKWRPRLDSNQRPSD